MARPPPITPPLAPPDLSGHWCQATGCRRFGIYGFGPPGADAVVRWFCPRHRLWGQEWWDEARGAHGFTGPGPERQGGLF